MAVTGVAWTCRRRQTSLRKIARDRAQYRSQLKQFYEEHRPNNQIDIDSLLAKHQGREQKLLAKLNTMARDGKFVREPRAAAKERRTIARKQSRRGSFAYSQDAPEWTEMRQRVSQRQALPASPAAVGAKMKIVGVRSLPELNGQTGVALGKTADGRIRVVLDAAHHGRRNITLPPENLAPVATAAKDAGTTAAAPPAQTHETEHAASAEKHKSRKTKAKKNKKDEKWRERARKRRRASVARQNTANLSAKALKRIEAESKEAAEELAAARRRQKWKKAAKKATILSLVVEGGSEHEQKGGKRRGKKKKGKKEQDAKARAAATAYRRGSQARLVNMLAAAKLRQQQGLSSAELITDGSGDAVIRSSSSKPNALAQFKARVGAMEVAAATASAAQVRSRRRSSVSGPILRPSLLEEPPAATSSGAPGSSSRGSRHRRRSSVSGPLGGGSGARLLSGPRRRASISH